MGTVAFIKPARIADGHERLNRKTWSGPFNLERRCDTLWVFHGLEPARIDVYVIDPRPAESAADAASMALTFDRIEIDWLQSSVEVALWQGSTAHRILVRTAFAHEPKPALYAALPLERFTARAQSFWRRVFLLVKLPGGRALLGLIARRARA